MHACLTFRGLGDARPGRLFLKIVRLWARRAQETPVAILGLRLRGPGRRSLGAKSQKVSKKSPRASQPRGPKSPKKVSKKVRKVSKKSENGFLGGLFRPFSRLFSDFWDPGAGRPRETFSRLFGDFLVFDPETPSPRSTEPQFWGDSQPLVCTFVSLTSGLLNPLWRLTLGLSNSFE